MGALNIVPSRSQCGCRQYLLSHTALQNLERRSPVPGSVTTTRPQWAQVKVIDGFSAFMSWLWVYWLQHFAEQYFWVTVDGENSFPQLWHFIDHQTPCFQPTILIYFFNSFEPHKLGGFFRIYPAPGISNLVTMAKSFDHFGTWIRYYIYNYNRWYPRIFPGRSW